MYKDIEVTCKICGKTYQRSCHLKHHLEWVHNTTAEEYFDTYIEPNDDHLCKCCGKEKRKFISVVSGYLDTCCKNNCSKTYGVIKRVISRKEHGLRDPEWKKQVREKAEKTCAENHPDDPTCGRFGSKRQKEVRENKLKENPDFLKEAAKKGVQTARNNNPTDPWNHKQNTETRNKKKEIDPDYYKPIWENMTKKIKATKKEHFGNENYNNSEKMLQTFKDYEKNFEIENKCILNTTLIKQLGTGMFIKYMDLDYIYDKNGFKYIKNEDINKINEWINTAYQRINARSLWETAVIDYIKTIYNGNIEQSNRTVIPGKNGHHKEIDIYMPDIKLGIECNGIWFHAIEYRGSKEMHLYKTEECRKQGIHLLHIYDNDWENNKTEVEKLIKECIEGTFINKIEVHGDVIIGDNEKPIFGNVEIIKITEPELIERRKDCHVYNCGKIFYKKVKENTSGKSNN